MTRPSHCTMLISMLYRRRCCGTSWSLFRVKCPEEMVSINAQPHYTEASYQVLGSSLGDVLTFRLMSTRRRGRLKSEMHVIGEKLRGFWIDCPLDSTHSGDNTKAKRYPRPRSFDRKQTVPVCSGPSCKILQVIASHFPLAQPTHCNTYPHDRFFCDSVCVIFKPNPCVSR